MSKLDPYELEVLEAYESGKLKPVAGKAELQPLRAAARATAIKDKLGGIARGEKAIEDGRTVTHSQAKQRMARWLK